MNKLTIAVHTALAAVFVTGCSTYNGGSGQSTYSKVEPFQRVTQEASPDAWYQLGRYYQGQRRWTDAENAFRRVLGLDASHAEAHNALGAVLAARGFLAHAETEFLAASRLAPKSAHIRGNLGRIQLLQGRTGEALLTLEDALRLDPVNLTVRANLDRAMAAHNPVSQPAAVVAESQGEGRGGGVDRTSPLTHGSPAAPIPEVVPVPSTIAGLASIATLPSVALITSPVPDRNQVVVLTAVPASDPRSSIQQVAVMPSSDDVSSVTALSPGVVGVVPLSASLPPVARPDPVPLAKTVPEPVLLPEASTDMQKTRPAAQQVRLEVSNGNGVTGMARRVRQSLSVQGYGGIRVTNQLPYRQQVTAIQYRVGFENQAHALGSQFPLQEKVVYQARLDVRADVRIVLGRDLPRDFALNEGGPLLLAAVEEK